MNGLRRLSLVVIGVAMVVMALAPNLLSASLPAPALAQGSPTPDELCAQAMVNLPEPQTRQFEQAADVLQEGADYWAILCTIQGAIAVDLLEAESPLTVNNFVFLAQQNYYNNTTFHRVLAGFMAQGGDPTGTGSGGPGYEFADETSNGLVFDQPGLLAMANAGPGTNGSQFFITYAPTSWLDGNHTIFGRVMQGLNTAELLTVRDPEQAPDYAGDTLYTVLIVDDPASITVTPDAPPDLDHIQKVMANVLLKQLNTIFEPTSENPQPRDRAAEALAWTTPSGSDTAAASIEAALSEHGFLGAAALDLKVNDCPTDPTQLPIWGLGFAIADYGSADNAAAALQDPALGQGLVDAGVFESVTDLPDRIGRVYRVKAAGEWCGPEATYYRYDMAFGHFVVTASLVVDTTQINESSDPTGQQFAEYVIQDLLLTSIGATLDRASAGE